MTKIRTEISIESNERLTITRKRYSVRGWCDDCKRISIMVLPTDAAFLSFRDIDSIIALMYSGKVHLRCFEEKGLYICMTSLCLYPFEKEFDEAITEDGQKSIEILADVKTRNYNFIHKE